MPATNELRRLPAEQSLPRFEPCLPRPVSEPGLDHRGQRRRLHWAM